MPLVVSFPSDTLRLTPLFCSNHRRQEGNEEDLVGQLLEFGRDIAGAMHIERLVGEMVKPIFRDIRRYFCEYCGICRSKKSLITSHILTHHKEEMEEKGVDEEEKIEGTKSNTCTECGVTFKKPAYLKQHMQSHSLEASLLI